MCAQFIHMNYWAMAVLGHLSMNTWPSLEEIECNSFLTAQRNYASTIVRKWPPIWQTLVEKAHFAREGDRMERCKEKRKRGREGRKRLGLHAVVEHSAGMNESRLLSDWCWMGCYPCAWEAKGGRSWIWGQITLHCETTCQQTNQNERVGLQFRIWISSEGFDSSWQK